MTKDGKLRQKQDLIRKQKIKRTQILIVKVVLRMFVIAFAILCYRSSIRQLPQLSKLMVNYQKELYSTDCWANNYDFYPLYRLPDFNSKATKDSPYINTRGDGKQYPGTMPSESYFINSGYTNVSKKIQNYMTFYVIINCVNIIVIILTVFDFCFTQKAKYCINMVEGLLPVVYWIVLMIFTFFYNMFST